VPGTHVDTGGGNAHQQLVVAERRLCDLGHSQNCVGFGPVRNLDDRLHRIDSADIVDDGLGSSTTAFIVAHGSIADRHSTRPGEARPESAVGIRWIGQDVRVTPHIDWHSGSRAELRPLFELAEDSASQLDQYLELGRVLVARSGSGVIGHLQLIPTTNAGEIELKNMAVVPEQQSTGVGRALVASAIRRAGAEGWSQMLVATAAADVGTLRFYQRVGFRMLSVERDAFIAATGYPDPIVIDGIPLRDRVWLSQALPDDGPGALHASAPSVAFRRGSSLMTQTDTESS
jgi:GNAT superfamily N-acetyltransferase